MIHVGIIIKPKPMIPNSSYIIAPIKSFCDSGIYPNFWVEFPKPTPKRPPLLKAIKAFDNCILVS